MMKTTTTLLTTALVSVLALSRIAAAAEGTVGGALDDTAITAKVKAALIENKSTKERQIDVDTKNGIVHLNGFVDTVVARSEAGTTARRIDGVKRVENDLTVKGTETTVSEKAGDALITTKVKTALAGDSRTSAYKVDVATHDGMVSLSGEVASDAEKAAVEAVASKVKGIKSLKNGLTVHRG
jgi:hyperosmotically inducible protein